MAKGIVALEADVSKEDQVQGAIKKAAEALGGLNVLVNNAGLFRDALLVKVDKETGEIKQMSLDELARGDRRRSHRPVPLHARVRRALHRAKTAARRAS